MLTLIQRWFNVKLASDRYACWVNRQVSQVLLLLLYKEKDIRLKRFRYQKNDSRIRASRESAGRWTAHWNIEERQDCKRARRIDGLRAQRAKVKGDLIAGDLICRRYRDWKISVLNSMWEMRARRFFNEALTTVRWTSRMRALGFVVFRN